MVMRLFSPTQAQSEARGQRARVASRDKEVSDTLVRKQQEMNDLGMSFQEMLASQQARWALEETAHEADAQMRRKEIRDLEDRKFLLLAPVDEIRKSAENLMQEAQDRMNNALEKEKECDRLADILEQRLGEVSDREINLKSLEDSLNRRSEGVALQEKQIRVGARAFSEEAERLRADKDNFNRFCEQKEQEFSIRDNDTKLRNQESFDKEKELKQLKVYLTDRASMLDREERRQTNI